MLKITFLQKKFIDNSKFFALKMQNKTIFAKIALFCIFSAKNLDLSINFAFLQKT